ncbi:MAG: C45 family autoproteolytic acyltransferase/hydrolase [Promethearchaeota archaeon]
MQEDSQIKKVNFRYITLEGSHYEIGYQLGKKFRAIEELHHRVVTKSFNPRKTGFESFNEMLKFYESFSPGISEEVQGLADGFGTSPEKIAYFIVPRDGKYTCSQLAVLPPITESDSIFVARNYDYHPSDEDRCLIRTKVPKNYEHIGFSMECLGRADGINSQSLVVSMTGGGAWDAPIANQKSFYYYVAIRVLLDKCKTVDEAVALLQEMPIYTSTIYLIVDKSGTAALVEGMDSSYSVKFIDSNSTEPFLFSTNHYTQPKMQSYNKYVNPWLKPNSQARYKIIEKKIRGELPNITKETLMELLSQEIPDGLCSRYFEEWFGTLWSMLFDITNENVDVCFGPPTHNQYVKFSLKDNLPDNVFPAILVNKYSSS